MKGRPLGAALFLALFGGKCVFFVIPAKPGAA